MNEWLYLISGFAFLLAEEKPAGFGPYSSFGFPESFFREMFHLAWQIALLLAFYFFVLESRIPPGYEKEPLILFFLPASYGLSRLQGKTSGFFLCVFSFCYFVMLREMGFSLWRRLLTAVEMTVAVGFVQALILGLKDKLLLSSVPKPLEGLPILFVTLALLSLALIGFQGMLA